MTPPFVHDVNDYFTYAKATLQEVSETNKVSDMLVVMRGSNLPAEMDTRSHATLPTAAYYNPNWYGFSDQPPVVMSDWSYI